VLFVDKAVEHVDAMNATGLRISGSESLKILPGHASRAPDGPWVCFLAVKSQDTEAALETTRRSPVGHGGRLAAERHEPPAIAKRLGKERVVGAFVSFPADWQAPAISSRAASATSGSAS
jgi:hypothetical protein